MNEFDELPVVSSNAAEKKDAAPPSPMGAPLPAAAEKGAKHTRRLFLFKLSLLLNGAVGAVLAVPILGYLLGPMFRRDSSYNSWIPLIDVDAMPVGATRLVEYLNPVRTSTDGETAKVACWTRRLGKSSYEVFAINCAHLGCPVRWFEQSQLFLCPCHGGTYYSDGSRASGPPPRGLYKYAVRIEHNQVLIDAGEMPTLSNRTCNEKRNIPLLQIQPKSDEESAKNFNLFTDRTNPQSFGKDV